MDFANQSLFSLSGVIGVLPMRQNNRMCECMACPATMFVFKLSITLTSAPRGTDRSPEYNEYICYKLSITLKISHLEPNPK